MATLLTQTLLGQHCGGYKGDSFANIQYPLTTKEVGLYWVANDLCLISMRSRCIHPTAIGHHVLLHPERQSTLGLSVPCGHIFWFLALHTIRNTVSAKFLCTKSILAGERKTSATHKRVPLAPSVDLISLFCVKIKQNLAIAAQFKHQSSWCNLKRGGPSYTHTPTSSAFPLLWSDSPQ